MNTNSMFGGLTENDTVVIQDSESSANVRPGRKKLFECWILNFECRILNVEFLISALKGVFNEDVEEDHDSYDDEISPLEQLLDQLRLSDYVNLFLVSWIYFIVTMVTSSIAP